MGFFSVMSHIYLQDTIELITCDYTETSASIICVLKPGSQVWKHATVQMWRSDAPINSIQEKYPLANKRNSFQLSALCISPLTSIFISLVSY